jgi:hypothetical protein
MMSVKGWLDTFLSSKQKLTWLDGLALIISSLPIICMMSLLGADEWPSIIQLMFAVPVISFGQCIVAGCFLFLNSIIFRDKDLDIVRAIRYVAIIAFTASILMIIIYVFGEPPDGWYRGRLNEISRPHTSVLNP